MYRRLCHRAILRHALLKKSISIFWHFPIKLDPRNPKMAFLFGFGPSKAPKSWFKVSVSDISSQARFEISGRPCQLAWSPGISGFDLGGSPGEISKTQTSNAFLEGLGAPNKEKEAIFGFRESSLIGKCQNPNIGFLEKA